jgi:hypothetical protein
LITRLAPLPALVAATLLAAAAQEPAPPLIDTSDTADTAPHSGAPEDSDDSEPEDSDPPDSEPEDSDPPDSEPTDSDPPDSEPTDSEPADAPPDPPPAPATIRALRLSPPADGARVELAEVVLAARGPTSLWVQDPAGGRGAGLHLLVVDGPPDLPRGAHLQVSGAWSRHPYGVELLVAPADLLDLGDRSEPAVAALPSRATRQANTALPWADQLVTVTSPTALALGPRGPLLGPPPSGLVLGRSLHDPGPVRYRASWRAITGVLVNTPAGPQLWPRDAADLLDPAPPQLPADLIPAGALRLEELHLSPQRGLHGAACAGGEYIELRNVSEQPIDLDGLYLWDAATRLLREPEQIRQPLPLQPGQLALGARLGPDCYGLPADFSFAFELTDDGDHLQLFHQHGVLAELDLSDWKPLWTGAAVQRDPRKTDGKQAEQRAGWCLATEPIAPGADLGSPGRDNPPCAGWKR